MAAADARASSMARTLTGYLRISRLEPSPLPLPPEDRTGYLEMELMSHIFSYGVVDWGKNSSGSIGCSAERKEARFGLKHM